MAIKNAAQLYDQTIRNVLEDVRQISRTGCEVSTATPYERWVLEIALSMEMIATTAMTENPLRMNLTRLSPAARYLLQVLILGGEMGTITLYAQGIGMIQRRDVEGYRYIFGDEPAEGDPDLSQHILLRFHAAARELQVKKCATPVGGVDDGNNVILRATPSGFFQGGDVTVFLMALAADGYLEGSGGDTLVPDLSRPLKATDAMVITVMELLHSTD